MKYNIITVGREHGSGGRLVAKRLSELLKIPFYDKELIQLAAEESGLSEQCVEEAEQKHISGLLYSFYYDSNNLPVSDRVFLAQAEVICRVAKEGPCVIVGRCADYVLQSRDDCLNTFVYAPMEARIRRLTDEYKSIHKDPRAYLTRYDKRRAAYYQFFTGNNWGDYRNYHLMVNSEIGLDEAAAAIARVARGGSHAE